MYSPKFRKWLFNYMEQSGVQQAKGPKKAEMLSKLLDNCNYCRNEASYEEVKLICRFLEANGVAQTRSVVTRSNDLKEDLGSMLVNKKAATKKKSAKTDRSAGVVANASFQQGTSQAQPPLEYRLVSAQDINVFQNDVNTMLETGEWYLAGGVSVMTVAKVGSLYTQALYRY